MLQAPAIVIAGFLTTVLLFTAVSLLVWAKNAPGTDWLEAIYIAGLGTVIFTGLTGTALVSAGQFSLAFLAVLLLLGAAGLFWWQRPFSRPQFPGIKWPEWLLLLLLLGASVVYFRPHEYVLGGIDPGGYVNIAATAVRTGDFVLTDEWTGLLAQYPDVTLRPQPPEFRTEYLQFVGWYVDDTQADTIIPQFFPFHAMLLAVGIAVGGLYAGLLVTPLWGVLSLAAVYLLARRLFNAQIALSAAVLLAITPTQIYFARYPTTEPLTLLLVFTGLLALQTLTDEHNRASLLWGVLAGGAFGAAFLTRIDLPLVAIIVAGFLLLRRWQGAWHAGWTAAALTLGLLSGLAGASAWWQNWPYVWNTYGSVFRVLTNSSLVVAVGLVTSVFVLAFGLVMWRLPWNVFVQSRLARGLNGTTFRCLLASLVILLSLFAYFVRPALQPAAVYETWLTGSEALTLDGENWVRLGWYITPLGLALATAGLAHILRTHSFNRYGLFLAVGTVTIVQYVYRIFNTAYHIYAMRRYVPIVLPMLILYTAVALYVVLSQQQRRWAVVLGGLLTLGLIAGLLFQSRYVLPLRDLRGATEALVSFHEQLEPDAIIVISEPPSSTFADTLGPPLRFIFGHDIATIRQDDGAEAFIATLFDYAQEQERPVQLIAIAPVLDSVRANFSLEPVAFFPIRLPKLRSTFTDFPADLQTVYYGIEIYDVKPHSASLVGLPEQPTLTIDIGSLDAAYIVDGFYGKEPLAGNITARWTTDWATLAVPTAPADQMQLAVQAKIFRPDVVSPTAVSVWLDGQEVGQFTPTAEWQTYQFTVNLAGETAVAQLGFQAETFNPASLEINADTRDLGFLLDWVRINPVANPEK